MRYAADHKHAVRARLLEHAARLVRGGGVAGTSVGHVMKAAQMTVGGFYRHFESQHAMLGEALALAMREARGRLFCDLEHLTGKEFEAALLDRYLSRVHFEDVEHGCPVAASVTEAARLPQLVNAALIAEVADIVAVAAKQLSGPQAQTRAWALFCACVGTLAVARTIGGERGLSMMNDVREFLKAR